VRTADISIGRFEHGERDAAVVSTTRAFWPDPLFGYFCRDLVQEHNGVAFFAALFDDAAAHGEVWVARAGERCVGVACWLPPEQVRRGARRESRIYRATARVLLRGRNRRRGLALLNTVERRHPTEEHRYLVLLAVDPAFQGRGIGHLLLEPGLERCDLDGLPAYLETQKEENLAFYHRFGFSLRDEIQLPGTPSIWTLWRDPSPR
jgi:GNAT superfamily N-acetyltransferase